MNKTHTLAPLLSWTEMRTNNAGIYALKHTKLEAIL